VAAFFVPARFEKALVFHITPDLAEVGISLGMLVLRLDSPNTLKVSAGFADALAH
jgi:hypothetical protein